MGYNNFKRYCRNYRDIENYEKAKADDFKGWECHHRLETHTPDGKRREVDIGYKKLKALGLYYNRPAEELIFLTTREHNAFNKGKKHTEETKKKLREANKGKTPWNKGKKMSEEYCRKNSESHKGKTPWNKGKQLSEETKKKLREVRKGTHWYNNGKINTMSKECPEGFVPGRIKKALSNNNTQS